MNAPAPSHSAAAPANPGSLKHRRILLAHSNTGIHMRDWHQRREQVARSLGYQLDTFCMTDLHPYINFPVLDRLWRRRDPALMRLYEALGQRIADVDVFIHYNGALIHPEFIAQFRQLKVYHCADDPDASAVISRPVAPAYDICAISNPSCLDDYRAWGCANVFFWPLGAFHFDDAAPAPDVERDVPLVFIGSKTGTTSSRLRKHIPLLRRMPLIYPKMRLLLSVEDAFPELIAHGGGWNRGWISDEGVVDLYRSARVAFNIHNGLGPINGRLYDLAAFGVCQVCDNKPNLHHVFEEGHEIVGFDTQAECIELIRYYLNNPKEARVIAEAGRRRYMRDYTTTQIWLRFFGDLEAMAFTTPRVQSAF